MAKIAYAGEKFSIEWFTDSNDECDTLTYFEELSSTEQDKTFYLFKRMGDFGKVSDITKFRNEGDGIFAFKPQPHRFLCFFISGRKIIVTNAFRKSGDKLPKQEKEKALLRMRNYLENHGKKNMKTKTGTRKRDDSKTTFDRIISDPRRRKKFDDGYAHFLMSEFLIELMVSRNISVRKLATQAKVAASMIQDLRSGKRANPGIDVFSRILKPLGAELIVRSGSKEMALTASTAK